MSKVIDNGLAVRPAHVPPSLVHDFDMIAGQDYLADPYRYASEVTRKAPPIFWTPRNRGHWVITGFDLVSQATKDWEHFSNQIIPKDVLAAMVAKLPAGASSPVTALPSSLDPPEHGAYREPISSAFSPRIANGLKEQIRGLAVELIEDIKPRGACALMAELTEILPVRMFLRIFGLPLEKQAEYRRVLKSVTGQTAMRDFDKIVENTTALVNAFAGEVEARRDDPRDDLISRLWQTRINGEPMTLDTIKRFCLTMFLAGLDTVVNAMALGTRHLAAHPEDQDRLRDDPGLIPVATEELLRLYSISLPIRTVARDVSIGGVTLKEGEQVHLYHAAANRDAQAFSQADRFSLERAEKAHLAFGGGPHRCLGMHLARVELHVYYEELLRRLPRFRLDPARHTAFHGGISMGPNEVYLRWD